MIKSISGDAQSINLPMRKEKGAHPFNYINIKEKTPSKIERGFS